MKRSFVFVLALSAVCALVGARSRAADEEKSKEKRQAELTFEIAEGRFKLIAPDTWERKQPKVRIIDHEFEVPAAEGDEQPGRVTVMGAGGTIDDNLKRWYGQFEQPDGSKSEDAAKVEKLKAAGQEVTLVDLAGTYLDKPPFANSPAKRRENYRMLAAVVQTKQGGKSTGNYFIKLIGPEKTVAGQVDAFRKMIEGLAAAN